MGFDRGTWVAVLLTLTAGCDLLGVDKDRCLTSADCLDGFVCGDGGCALAPAPPVSCDPLGSACATLSAGCFPVGTGASALCLTPGPSPTGAACTAVLGDPPECERGNLCLNVLDFTTNLVTRKCAKLCNGDGGVPGCSSGKCYKGGGVDFGACI